MPGYERSTRGLSPAQIKRRKRRPAGAPRAGETTARTSGTGKTQPVMAGTKKAADKARAKAKRTSVTTTKRKPAAKTTTTKKSTPKFNPTYGGARKKILRERESRPAKPKPSDYKSASAYKRAADSWNRKYGTQGTTTKPKKGVDYGFKKVKVDPNKRGKDRVKRALGAVAGPVALALVPGATARGLTKLPKSTRDKLTKVKKLAATTTRVGVKGGRRTGEAVRPVGATGRAKGQLSGISKKTQRLGRKIRRGAGVAAATGAIAGTVKSTSDKRKKRRTTRRGRRR
jgi:hypothetical protein